MTITVTWDEGNGVPVSFTVPADVLASLDNFRQTITQFSNGQMVPTYLDVKSMIVGSFVQSIVMPALQRFPTAGIQAAQANLAAAQANLAAAQAAALPGFAP